MTCRAPRLSSGVLTGAVAFALLAGCGATSAGSGTSSSTDASSGAADSSSASATTGQDAQAGPLTLAFGGDVHFTDRTASLPAQPGPLIDALKPLAAADLAFVNLETAITERGTEEPKKFHFRAPASALTALQEAGVDAVTLANNHAVDYGKVGLEDTLAAVADSPIPAVGLGANEAAAYRPAILTAKGLKVAFIGATQVPDRTLAAWSAEGESPGVASSARRSRLAQEVEAARKVADVVVVYLHWGTDYTSCPDADQKATAERLVAAGADVVVGAHAHRVQGGGWTDDGKAFVDYGLGNFVWWRSSNVGATDSGVLTLTMDGRETVQSNWTPLRIDENGLPRPVPADDPLVQVYPKAQSCSGLASDPPSGG